METKLKERPQLLVDLSKQVGETLSVDTPVLSASPSLLTRQAPVLTKAEGLTHGPVLTRGGLADRAVLRRGVQLNPQVRLRLTEQLVRRIKTVVPEDGDWCFTLTHDYADKVGAKWENHNEAPFWLGSQMHLFQAVDEWMSSEYEAVAESLYGDDIPGMEVFGKPALMAYPSTEDLLNAWDAVCQDSPREEFQIHTGTADGLPGDDVVMTAAEIMGHAGYSADVLLPLVVVADALLPADLEAIYADDYVSLDPGYVVTGVEYDQDLTTVHIEPNTNSK